MGGGPAGASAARRAAIAGASVLLVDAATFPRSKPCGGAVSEQAMSYLDFPLDEKLIQAEVFGARVHFGPDTVEGRKPFRIAVLTTRTELDAYLLEKAKDAGVTVVEGCRVKEVIQTPNDVTAFTADRKFTSKFLIAGDGAQSVISRTIRPSLAKSEFAVAYEGDISCSSAHPGILSGGLIDIFFGREYMGYSWIFPKRDHWNIGVGALASEASNVKKSTLDFIESHRNLPHDTGAAIANGKGWTIPAGGYRRTVVKGRVFLIGDAAGFVDPFYGEGIAYAIQSGSKAGDLVGAAAQRSTSVAAAICAREYALFCRRQIDADLRYGLLFARLLHAWPNMLLRLFSTNAALIDKYLEVPAARLTYRQYFRWFLPRAVVGVISLSARDLLAWGRKAQPSPNGQ